MVQSNCQWNRPHMNQFRLTLLKLCVCDCEICEVRTSSWHINNYRVDGFSGSEFNRSHQYLRMPHMMVIKWINSWEYSLMQKMQTMTEYSARMGSLSHRSSKYIAADIDKISNCCLWSERMRKLGNELKNTKHPSPNAPQILHLTEKFLPFFVSHSLMIFGQDRMTLWSYTTYPPAQEISHPCIT